MTIKNNRWQEKKHLILLGILLLSGEVAISQTKIQVITKTISRNIPYIAGKTINIEGEKATINIQSWDKNYISATISLIAKHPSKKTAEEDIRFIDYKVIDSGDVIELSNFFSQKSGYKEITSNLTAKFEISIPNSCPLSIVDVYGLVSLKNIKGKINVDLSFAQLSMSNLEGDLSIKTYYGDIDAENINTTLKLKSEMADLTFLNLLGNSYFETNYGNLSIAPNEKLTGLKIDASRTAIQIEVGDSNAFSLKFEAQNGDITVPRILKKQVVKNLFKEQFYQNNNKPLIQVNGIYSSITLKNN